MLVVRPGFRGCGLASGLLSEACDSFRVPLWASVHVGSPGHRLLVGRGWHERATTSWRDDANPGVVLTSPRSEHSA